MHLRIMLISKLTQKPSCSTPRVNKDFWPSTLSIFVNKKSDYSLTDAGVWAGHKLALATEERSDKYAWGQLETTNEVDEYEHIAVKEPILKIPQI